MTVRDHDALNYSFRGDVTWTLTGVAHLFGCLLRDVKLPELLQEHRVDILRARVWA